MLLLTVIVIWNVICFSSFLFSSWNCSAQISDPYLGCDGIFNANYSDLSYLKKLWWVNNRFFFHFLKLSIAYRDTEKYNWGSHIVSQCLRASVLTSFLSLMTARVTKYTAIWDVSSVWSSIVQGNVMSCALSLFTICLGPIHPGGKKNKTPTVSGCFSWHS